ncbi:MAG TPA: DsbA family oxidoreductase [Azospirillaceae bacterium]|nr:DsbA family oxidoreductase [Azospirillaceae bacterium]
MLVEIFADLICPWCYIGKYRLDRALAERPSLRADLRWLPFQLNPDMPAGGMDRFMYLAAKFGGIERARQIYAVIEQTAARDGLPLALERIRRTPSTLDAHRLIRYADRLGRSQALTMAIYDAYFQDGADIGDRELLAALAAHVGLDRDGAMEHLRSEADVAAVKASDVQARQLGIQAVPCFIFNRRYAMAGAQEPAAFLPLLDLTEDTATVSA